MPDDKKESLRNLKSAPLVSPRQRVLDAEAREHGRNMSEFLDGGSQKLLEAAKNRVGDAGATGNGFIDSYESGMRSAGPDEAPRFKSIMDAAYWKGKEANRKRDRLPNGYDASMRDTPASPVSTADAMKADQAKKATLTPKQILTAPMFQKPQK